MKLVYTHPNRILVENARNLLESAGIETRVHNEFAGGAIGELAPIDAWMEVWIVNERKEAEALRIMGGLGAEGSAAEWICSRCGEGNPASFDTCWNCEAERPQN